MQLPKKKISTKSEESLTPSIWLQEWNSKNRSTFIVTCAYRDFDTVKYKKNVILQSYKIDDEYLRIITQLYQKQRGKIENETSEETNIEKGVRQGSMLR